MSHITKLLTAFNGQPIIYDGYTKLNSYVSFVLQDAGLVYFSDLTIESRRPCPEYNNNHLWTMNKNSMSKSMPLYH
jgi:hypothetical protein